MNSSVKNDTFFIFMHRRGAWSWPLSLNLRSKEMWMQMKKVEKPKSTYPRNNKNFKSCQINSLKKKIYIFGFLPFFWWWDESWLGSRPLRWGHTRLYTGRICYIFNVLNQKSFFPSKVVFIISWGMKLPHNPSPIKHCRKFSHALFIRLFCFSPKEKSPKWPKHQTTFSLLKFRKWSEVWSVPSVLWAMKEFNFKQNTLCF